MKIDAAFFTHIGRKKQNEDAIFPASVAGEWCWAAIADGIGGHPGGAVAARTAIRVIKQRVHEKGTVEVTSLFKDARYRMIKLANKHPELLEMGTTLTVMGLHRGQAYIGHVGDTRVYHLRGNDILMRTRDQTEAQHLIDRGLLTEETAQCHPGKNILLSAVSPNWKYQIYRNDFEVMKGDRILLLTDGAYDLLTDSEIQYASFRSKKSSHLAEDLENMILSHYPKDDYSAIVISMIEV